MRQIIGALAGAFSALSVSVAPAAAVTFDLSELDLTQFGSRSATYYQAWTGPNSTGTEVFAQSGAGRPFGQVNGWTLGSGSGQATLYEQGQGRGNNGFSQVYMPTGGPAFPIPAGQTIGQNNTQYTGFYAGNGSFTPYLWFGNPGSTLVTPAAGSPVFVDSLYVAVHSSQSVTIYGYADLGQTLIAGDVFTIQGGSAGVQQVILNWAGVEQLSFVGGSGIYVNDIQVNDLVAVPVPVVGAGLPGLMAGCMALVALARRQRKRLP